MSKDGRGIRSERADTYATRLMGGLFGLGAVCFVIGPISAYANRVGAHGDALTFFIGSILFTGGGLLQSWLAYPERDSGRSGWLAWYGGAIQSIGTLLFNFMTLESLSLSTSARHYNALVWTPNAIGSACFLVSGIALYLAAPRDGWRPKLAAEGWWEPPVNLLGCVLFGISAIAGRVTGPAGREIDLTAANWTTTFGAVCFLALALAAVIIGMTFRIPRLSRLEAFEARLRRELEADGDRVVHVVEREIDTCSDAVGREVASIEGAIERLERRGETELG